MKLKPNLQIAKFTNQPSLSKKMSGKSNHFSSKNYASIQLSDTPPKKKKQCDTFLDFVCFFVVFGSKMFASSVFRDQILAVQSKSPTATSKLSASKKCLNGQKDCTLRETLGNVGELYRTYQNLRETLGNFK